MLTNLEELLPEDSKCLNYHLNENKKTVFRRFFVLSLYYFFALSLFFLSYMTSTIFPPIQEKGKNIKNIDIL